MKMIKKVFCLVMLTVMLLAIFQSNTASAYDFMNTINSQAGNAGDSNVTGPVTSISQAIITIARVVCTGVAIVMLLVLAMKYMMSAPGDRATIKKHAVVYIVGAIVMFASTGILGIIQKFSNNVKV